MLHLALLTVVLAGAATPAQAVVPPGYGAAIRVDPDVYAPDETLEVGNIPFDSSSSPLSRNAVTFRLEHTSMLGTGSIGSASASPDHGGTVRAIASTEDELIGSFASLTYAFQLVPRPGVLLPDELPLRVEALGATGTDNYASARISFVLNYQSATSFRSILLDTGATSTPLGVITWGGNGRINVDQMIDVAPGTDISVFLHARAGAGTPVRRPRSPQRPVRHRQRLCRSGVHAAR